MVLNHAQMGVQIQVPRKDYSGSKVECDFTGESKDLNSSRVQVNETNQNFRMGSEALQKCGPSFFHGPS